MNYISTDYGDGFGSHLQQYIFGIVFAENHGNRLYLSYNTNFEHNYVNDPTYKDRILSYINLHKYYGLPEGINENSLPKIDMHYQYCLDNIDRIFISDSFELLKLRFFENKSNPYDQSFYNVAVHVRRPNPHDNRLMGADTPDAYYLAVINKIRATHSGEKPLKFHIYSQGSPSMFSIYNAPDTELHIDTSVEETYNGLLFGDALITSGSALSYSAALFTSGTVYFKTFWYPPAKHWIIADQLINWETPK
jgi:hypothetical protein